MADPAALADLDDSDRAHCEDYLKQVASRLTETALTWVTTVMLEVPVADVVLDYADKSAQT